MPRIVKILVYSNVFRMESVSVPAELSLSPLLLLVDRSAGVKGIKENASSYSR